MSLQETLSLKVNVLNQDERYVAHPGYTLFDYQDFPPFHIRKAEGSTLYCANGHTIIDAIASWWCKPLGHQHPAIKKAVIKQMDSFEHVMFGQTTFDVIGELSEYLAHLLPGENRVFYGGDGSTAIEIALKMSLQIHQICGESSRNRFACFSNGYHGETLATLSLCDHAHFASHHGDWVQNKPAVISSIPYVQSTDDPLWSDASLAWEDAKTQLELVQHSLSAIVLEPILQAAGGMKFYSRDFLIRLSAWAKARGIHVIADEITTGFWRLGKRLACDFAGIKPDFLCLGKALTGGFVAMSAVVIKQELYTVLSESDFVHSNAYAGNAIAAAAALASCKWMETHHIRSQVTQLASQMQEGLTWLVDRIEILEKPRVFGGVAAADLPLSLLQKMPDFSKRFSKAASESGVFLRPLHNTIYWCPPLIINDQEVDQMITGTERALRTVLYTQS